MEQFWAVQEQIQRGLWGLVPSVTSSPGSTRRCPGTRSWAKFKAAQVQAIGKDQ